MSKEVQIRVDKWYSEYCKVNKVAPTWSELILKTAEIEKEVQKEREVI